jgi:hypothetical protein
MIAQTRATLLVRPLCVKRIDKRAQLGLCHFVFRSFCGEPHFFGNRLQNRSTETRQEMFQ